MEFYRSIKGIVTDIEDFWTGANERTGCYKLVTLRDEEGNIITFVVTPATYFVNHIALEPGDMVIGFYDANAPVPLIYPPRYTALVMGKYSITHNIAVDYFDENLVSNDGMLKLNIGPTTKVILTNDQYFSGDLENRYLIVVYDFTTRSIPAQTTPQKVIVIC